MITELTSADLRALLCWLTMGTHWLGPQKGQTRRKWNQKERRGAFYGSVPLHRAHFKDCPACMRNHGNL